uniref:ABC transporter domain-containing protein n=1 Tax=Strongyloides papillosus TaxID=174720 RepID=A0A0N5C372_STREA
MWGAHLFLLLCRNILFLTRSKIWLLGEILLPILLITVQYYAFFNITDDTINDVEKVSYRETSPFFISGNLSDIPNFATNFIPNELYSRALLLYYEYADNKSAKVFHEINTKFRKLYGKNVYVKRMMAFGDFIDKIHSKGNVITIDDNEILLEQVVGLHIHKIRRNSINYTFYVQTLPEDAWNSDKYWFDPFLYYSKNSKKFSFSGKPEQPPYLSRGLLSYQTALLKIISNINSIDKNDNFSVRFRAFPYYTEISSPKQYMFDVLPFLWSLSIIFTVTHSVGSIVFEKELKITSYLKVIGVANTSYYGSFYICNYIKIFALYGLFIHPIYNILHYTNKQLAIILIIVYVGALCSFILFISTLFRNSINSMKLTFYLWLGLCVHTYITGSDQQSTFQYIYKSLNINNPFRYAIRNFAWAELRSISLDFDNIFEDPNNFFPTGYCIIMLIFDAFLYLILALYISDVYPKDGSPSITTYEFVFGREFHIQTRSTFDFQESTPDIFNSKDQVNWDVRLRNCTKIWSSTGERALDTLSFTARNGQITTLVGHNGAGKSTTYAILSGLTNLTSGRIYVGKENLIKNFEKFIEVIGYCPQYDAFFPHLTVFEQIFLITLLKKKIYGNIFWKRFIRKNDIIYNEIMSHLKSLNLKEIMNQKPFVLPSGTKRKVSLCMALAGNPKILLLDEPRSSTDIDSNIDIDNLLKKIKKDKTIILATHILDDDISFSDKLVFLSKGYVVTSGTQKELMSKFAPGYILNIQYKNKVTHKMVNNTLNIINKIIPKGMVHNNSKLNEISYLLPSSSKNDCIRLFQILEKEMNTIRGCGYQVFKTNFEDAYLKIDHMADMSNESFNISENAQKFANAICGVKRKKIKKCISLGLNQIKCMFYKQAIYTRRHWFQFSFQILIPLVLIFYKWLTLSQNKLPRSNQMVDFSHKYLQPFVLPYLVEKNKSINDGIDEKYIDRSLEDITMDLNEQYDERNVIVKKINENYNPVDFYLKYFMSEKQLGFGFEFHNPLDINNITIRFNNIAIHSTMIGIVEYFEIFHDIYVESNLRILSPRNINGSVITKPYSSSSSEVMPWLLDVEKDGTNVFFVFVLYSILQTSHSMIFLIDEKTSQFKHQQLSANIPKKIFFLGSFIFNLFTFIIGLKIMMLGLIFLYPKFLHVNNIICFGTISIVYFMANMPFVWMFSGIFQKPLKGYLFMIAFQFLFPMLFFLLSFIIVMFFHSFLPIQGVQAIGILSPSGCLIFHLTSIAGHMTFNDIIGFSYTFNILLKIQAIRGFITYIFFWFSEDDYIQYLYHRKIKRSIKNSIRYFGSESCKKVGNKITEKMEINGEISVDNIGKKFSKNKIIENVTFDISKNESFCLIGSNGAGKTLLFNILTKKTYPTKGNYYIKGIKLNRNQAKIGYCQQMDSFMPEFTVDQIMIFFAKLIGYVNYDEIVNEIFECFGLEKHRFKYFNKLSGGQKKRLAFSVAILTGEDILLLDEPTSSVDPKSRRFIWEFLKALKHFNRTILISTHNITECEYLCTKIGFFRKDKTFEVGSLEYLKKIFANGYIVSITIQNPSQYTWMKIEEKLMENFNASTVNFRSIKKTNEWKIIPNGSEKTWLEVNNEVEEIMKQFTRSISEETSLSNNTEDDGNSESQTPIVLAHDLSNCTFDKILFEHVIKKDSFTP